MWQKFRLRQACLRAYADSEGPDQFARSHSLIRAFADRVHNYCILLWMEKAKARMIVCACAGWFECAFLCIMFGSILYFSGCGNVFTEPDQGDSVWGSWWGHHLYQRLWVRVPTGDIFWRDSTWVHLWILWDQCCKYIYYTSCDFSM